MAQQQQQPVCIDGSLLEGGGQILRNSTALAAITGRSIQVDKIRAGRKNPGLSAQHLTGLQLVASITRGSLEGGAIRSTSISFSPGLARPVAGSYDAHTKTAGSCTLLVQQALPVLMFAHAAADSDGDGTRCVFLGPHKRGKGICSSSVLTLRGGTDAAFAPPVGYLEHVLLPTLKRLIAPLCPDLSLHCVKRGFYPKGGGVVQVTVPALPPDTPLPAWQLTDRGHLVRVRGYAVTAGKLRADVGARMAASATQHLRAALQDLAVVFGPTADGSVGTASDGSCSSLHGQGQGREPRDGPAPSVVLDIQAVQEPPDRAVGDGGSIVLVAETSTGCLLGASALAEWGVTAEAVGAMAARDLLEELRSGAAVDHWMQDQLIIFMALAKGSSSMLCGEPTLHTRTALSVAEQVLPVKCHVTTSAAGKLFRVQCTGAGVVSNGSGSL